VALVLVTAGCLLFAAALLATNIFPTRKRISEMESEQEQLRGEILELKKELGRLNLHGDALETDAYTIEKELRKAYNLTRDGEKVLRVDGKKAAE
jgi:cell division protein FtsB